MDHGWEVSHDHDWGLMIVKCFGTKRRQKRNVEVINKTFNNGAFEFNSNVFQTFLCGCLYIRPNVQQGMRLIAHSFALNSLHQDELQHLPILGIFRQQWLHLNNMLHNMADPQKSYSCWRKNNYLWHRINNRWWYQQNERVRLNGGTKQHFPPQNGRMTNRWDRKAGQK